MPSSMIEELFPEEDKKSLPPPPMPSSSMEHFLSIDSIIERARKIPMAKKKIPVIKETYTRGAAIAAIFR